MYIMFIFGYLYIYIYTYVYVDILALPGPWASWAHLRSVRMRGGAHGVLFIRSDALELVQRVVSELRRREEETRLQDLKMRRYKKSDWKWPWK